MARFYLLRDPGERSYQYAWKDQSFLGFQKTPCPECGRDIAVMEYSGGHCLLLEGGPKYPDHLPFCGAGERMLVLSERAARLLQESGITGIGQITPVRTAKENNGTPVSLPETAPGYVLAEVTGKIDLDLSKMCLRKKKVCKACGGFEWNRQRLHPIHLDESTWDGSDICRCESIPGWFIFSEAAAELTRKQKLKGFVFDPLE